MMLNVASEINDDDEQDTARERYRSQITDQRSNITRNNNNITYNNKS
jgi:hypothetical protein